MKNETGLGRYWKRVRSDVPSALLVAFLLIAVLAGALSAILLWRLHAGKIADPRAAVYGTVLSALATLIAALVAIVAIFLSARRADEQAHNSVRPALDVRARWVEGQIIFEIANEAEHPAMDFLVMVTRLYTEQEVKFYEWDDPRTTVLRPYAFDQRRQHYHSAGTYERVAGNFPPTAQTAFADLSPMDPMPAPPAYFPTLGPAERLVLKIVYRDVLDAWWILEREITLGIPPHLPGLMQWMIEALDMGERIGCPRDPYPDQRRSS